MSKETINLARLEQYLNSAAPGMGTLTSIEKFIGGQSNPTFLLQSVNGSYVLRSKPTGVLLKSAHAVEREFRVMQALEGSAVPVPHVLCLCEDPGVIGSIFFIMSYEEGQIFWDPALPELPEAKRSEIYDHEIAVLAQLHSLQPASIGLTDFGRPGNYFERQLRRWTDQYRASETVHFEAMESLITWLKHNTPEDDGQSALIHGDYRLDNLIMTPGCNRIQAVIDWELSTLGHPFADLAYFCMCLRMPHTGQIQGLAGRNRGDLGIPTEHQIITQYCALRGIGPITHWTFYLAFSFFRLAAICQGVMKRALAGNASSQKAIQVGELAPKLAQMGMEIINKEEP
ncbi:MAG: phosphotransferase family protein [Acidiferrobacteraceae bacterium]|mgnify:CR=1 FL=1|jgi:aminoglycoside phosphotransferase (APT) family kinase protein|nr:phosphotransferase family protein [Acidiferrobacteraceae bacterium]MDP6950794.1 phosphotransferase family protein [Arenicellales bacterium]HJP06801.1 phosphotransferase family protein [Arenicellales bacterium]|tara:strand:+ start:14322 stop:15350 length:1029 start_codon:yes stop_codon:yes gene_type:complete